MDIDKVLGPLPEPDMSHQKAIDDLEEEESYSANAMRAERERAYAAGVAASVGLNRCGLCCTDFYLMSYSGGAAKEGLFGRLTLRVGGKAQDYVKHGEPRELLAAAAPSPQEGT